MLSANQKAVFVLWTNEEGALQFYCRPAEEWTLEMFDKMQHYLARLCWDHTVSACMAHIPRYEETMV